MMKKQDLSQIDTNSEPVVNIQAEIKSEDNQKIPILDNFVPAGFPSPTQGIHSESIDLNRELVKHPVATFFARVSGDSMVNSGISDGDLIVVDKSLEPHDGSIAVCYLDGEFTLKTISIRETGVYLVPSNPQFKEIKVDEEANFQVWGIVTYVIKDVSSKNIVHRRAKAGL